MPTISPAEVRTRQKRALDAITERGLAGLLVWGKGGGSADRHGDLLYLSDHYVTFPTIQDVPGLWADRGFGAALVTAEGTLLFVDDEWDSAGAVCDRLVMSHDLVSAVVGEIRAAGLGSATLGVAGFEAMTARQLRRLSGELPELKLEDAEPEVMRLRMIKSPAEVELMRDAAGVSVVAIGAALDAVQVGATEADVAAAAVGAAARCGAALSNFFALTLGKDKTYPRNRAAAWSTDVTLERGDVFTFDMSGSLNGYFFDLGRCRAVGGDPTAEQTELFLVAKAAVDAGVAAIRPGATVDDVARPGLEVLAAAGMPKKAGDGFDGLGHGLGLAFEDPWIAAGDATIISPGMCLALEQLLIRDDVGVTFERNVVVTADGCLDLSPDVPVGWEGL